jgi:hypothetical protein
MLTKTDLKEISKIIKPLKDDLSDTKIEIKVVNAHNSRIEKKLFDMEEKLERNLSQWKSDLFDKIDKVLGRVTTAEEENTVLRSRDEGRLEECIALTARIKKLEDIHPNGRHPSL